jgi:hypothetical protein
MTDLNNWAANVWNTRPDALNEEIMFSSDWLPAPPGDLTTDSIVLEIGVHEYGNFRIEQLHWHATRDTFRYLGLAILIASLKAQANETRIRLTHPASHIRNLIIKSSFPYRYPSMPELGIAIDHYGYWPGKPHRHPWLHLQLPAYELPHFDLCDLGNLAFTEQQRAERDTVRGFGSVIGAIRFASLLLDIGNAQCEANEFHLECDAGFRGVAPASVEVSLWLPGSIAWNECFFTGCQ